MALVPRDLLTDGTDAFFAPLRMIAGPGPGAVRNIDFAAGSGTIAQGTALNRWVLLAERCRP